MNLALHVLNGKEKGREFPIADGGELVLGRTKENELLIDNADAPIRQAVIACGNGRLSIKDAGSGTDTLVNSQKVVEADLKEGDRIRIGKVSMMVITLTRFSPAVTESPGGTQFLFKAQRPTAQEPVAGRALNGSLKEVSLSDLLQFLTQSRKHGVLRLDMGAGSLGKVFVQDGRIVYATWEGQAALGAARILFRLLRQTEGTFEFGPPEKHPVKSEIQQTADSLLLEGIQEGDEIAALSADLPPFHQRIQTAKPKGAVRLRNLSPDELDVLELALEPSTVQELIDRYPVSDLEAIRHLARLFKAGIVAPVSGS